MSFLVDLLIFEKMRKVLEAKKGEKERVKFIFFGVECSCFMKMGLKYCFFHEFIL